MIGDSASNADAIAVFILGTIIAATLAAIHGMRTMNKALHSALPDDDPLDCTCGASWCPYVPNAPQRNWMIPW